MFICGALSTDGSEYCMYSALFHQDGSSQPMFRRLDSGTDCELIANELGTIAVSNQTSGKTYQYYAIKLYYGAY